MANIQRNFIQGIMNKSLDERLVPNGQYVDAMNVRLGSTEDSEIGSVENTKGNTRMTTLEYNGTALSSNAKCIGACEDSSRETIYWFVHDPQFTGAGAGATGKIDLIVSLDVKDDILTYHVISVKNGSTSNTTLNFNSDYLITGVDFIGTELLYFTDNYNPPRYINVKKNYADPVGAPLIDQFTANELLVVKKPPITSPSITLQLTDGQENYIEERFISFAYRYRYSDNQYSAISQFSEAAFSPKPFLFEQASYLNEGMENSKNSVDVSFDSGDNLVRGIDLLFKESTNSVIKVIRKYDKDVDGIADNATVVETFDSNQIFTVLPDSELLRTFDNVPLFAKAQTFMGNRLVYGNYIEGYNLKDKNSNPLRLEYTTELVSTDVEIAALTTELNDHTYNIDGAELIPNSKLRIDFGGEDLKAGNVLEIQFNIVHNKFTNVAGGGNVPTQNSGTKFVSFSYVLPSDFANPHALATSTDFINRIGAASTIKPVYDAVNPTSCSGVTLTDNYNCIIPDTLTGAGPPATWTKYASGTTVAIVPPATPSSGEPIAITSAPANDYIDLTMLVMRWVDAPAGPTLNAYEYFGLSDGSAVLRSSQSPLSLHSNRNYEVGIIYMDDFNRPTTALLSTLPSAVHVPCGSSRTQNKIKVSIPPQQLAPAFATRYKFCIKPDRKDYNTIYSNIYFLDPVTSHTYFLIEGENARKVEEGERLIVKRDSTGATGNCSYATVLEKKAQAEDFISPAGGIVVPGGTYMKMLARDFSATVDDDDIISPGTRVTEENTFADFPIQVYTGLSGATPPLSIPSGSQIRVEIEFERRGGLTIGLVEVASSKCTIEGTFVSPQNYTDILEWFNANQIETAFNNLFTYEGTDTTQTLVRQADILAGSAPANYNLTNSATDVQYVWFKNTGTNEIQFVTRGVQSFGGSNKKRSTTRVRWEIIRADNTIVFESIPSDAEPDLWYESGDSYAINQTTGYHQGSDGVYQTSTTPAIVNTDFGNCYAFGNGVESYKILDSIVGKPLALGERFFSTSAEEYKEAHRFADLTYSGVFNDETNVDKLNEFNLGLVNFKTLEDSFGGIQLIDGRETDILVLQEDKVSYVLAGKNLLSDSTGGGTIASVPEVLGTQIARVEEYGISENPESYVQWGYNKFFTDAKRGAVIQLTGAGQNEQLSVISEAGMRGWFRDLFIGSGDTQKLGAFDPYMNEYVLASNDTKLPQEVEVQNCGVDRRLTVTAASPVSFTVNLGNTVGNTTIDYNIISFANAGSITIAEDYTGTSTNINTTGAGTINFNKNSVSDEDVVITLTPVGGGGPGSKETVVLDIKVGCPNATSVTLTQVCLTKDADVSKMIHNEYQWTDGTFISPLQSTRVTFIKGDGNAATEEVSDFAQITAPQGGGVIPNNGDTLTIISNKRRGDTYSFDNTAPPANRLMFLRSATNYPNTPTGITNLLAAATTLTISTPSSGVFEGTVTIPSSTDQYMYIIYDYFTS